MENDRVITPYGTGRVIESPEDRDQKGFLVELDKEFVSRKRYVFLKSEFQFIEDFSHLFIFDLYTRLILELSPSKTGRLASYAQLVNELKPIESFFVHWPLNVVHFELALKKKEFRVKLFPGSLDSRFLHVYGWLDRIGIMWNKDIPSGKTIHEVENYFREYKKRLCRTTKGVYLEMILDLQDKKILDQWFLTRNGIFEVN